MAWQGTKYNHHIQNRRAIGRLKSSGWIPNPLRWPAKTERIVNGSVSPYLAVHGSFWEIRTLIGRYRKIIGTGRNHWTIPNSFLSELLNFTNIATLQRLWLRTIPRLPPRFPSNSDSRRLYIDTRKIKDHALLFPLDTGTTARGAPAGKEGLPKFQIGDVDMNHYDILWRYHLYAHNQGRLHLPLGFKRGWVECVSTFLLDWILGRFQADADLCEWTHRVALVCDGSLILDWGEPSK